ncbi:hypothetical protein PQX77_016758, partial [Marasmius sp. AFHP31]
TAAEDQEHTKRLVDETRAERERIKGIIAFGGSSNPEQVDLEEESADETSSGDGDSSDSEPRRVAGTQED